MRTTGDLGETLREYPKAVDRNENIHTYSAVTEPGMPFYFS